MGLLLMVLHSMLCRLKNDRKLFLDENIEFLELPLYTWCLQNKEIVTYDDEVEKVRYVNFIYNQKIINNEIRPAMISDLSGYDKPKPSL